MSVFEKLVDFLTVVNDLNKRGLAKRVATEDLLASLTAEAINHYNQKHTTAPQQPQSQPQQTAPNSREEVARAEILDLGQEGGQK